VPWCRYEVKNFPSRENHTFCGYQLLAQHMVLLEERLNMLDVAELGIYVREVLILLSHPAGMLMIYQCSYARELWALVEMMQLI